MKLVAKIVIAAAAVGLPLAAYAASNQAQDNDASEKAALANAPTPNVSKAQAEQIALRAAPGGTIVETDYEQEGSGWRWSVDINENTKKREIGIDATSGKVIQNSLETDAEEAEDVD